MGLAHHVQLPRLSGIIDPKSVQGFADESRLVGRLSVEIGDGCASRVDLR
jgi:hypothetical protein